MAAIAPPIEGETWINSAPLTADHLRGRVAILVFWSAGCEASLRRLQQVQELLSTPPAAVGAVPDHPDQPLIALAVHTPRMTCDDDLDRLRRIVYRHRITIPIVHDPLYRTWSRYEPPGWPSTAVIDRGGRITGIAAGCHDIAMIEQAVIDACERPGGERRRRDDEASSLPVVTTAQAGSDEYGRRASWLAGPEGLAVDVAANRSARPTPRLIVADTGHDRLVIGHTDRAHQHFRVDLIVAGLDQPTAVTFTDRNTVAVVERGANRVMSVDVNSGATSTVTDQLSRPVGLAVDGDGSLVITDAGADTIHRATANRDRSGHLVLPIAGSGRTGVKSGRAVDAELAQPVAAVRTDAGVVLADAASSNLRLLTDRGDVVNITDSDLFDWGLIDGLAHRARLQRPAGLAVLEDGSVIVADSGNHRLRRLHHRRIETIGLNGLLDPTAVAALDDRIVVADTGNNRLIVVDPARQDAWIMAIDDLEHAPVIGDAEAGDDGRGQVSSGKATSAT